MSGELILVKAGRKNEPRRMTTNLYNLISAVNDVYGQVEDRVITGVVRKILANGLILKKSPRYQRRVS